jgi:hypothetical protein
MTTLIDFLPETFEAVKEQLVEDEKRWGDTWMHRPREGQEDRTIARFRDYFDQWEKAGVPIPWEKIIGGAHICMVRENHPEILVREGS